jgi:hypothetical protein
MHLTASLAKAGHLRMPLILQLRSARRAGGKLVPIEASPRTGAST